MKTERTQTPILNIGGHIQIGDITMVVDDIRRHEGPTGNVSPLVVLNDNGHFFTLTGAEVEKYLV